MIDIFLMFICLFISNTIVVKYAYNVMSVKKELVS